jgi:hypothetical protein
MTQNANIRFTGRQMRLVEEGLRTAFVGYNELARLVLYELEERLNGIVVQQAAKEVPGNARLQEARDAVLGPNGRDAWRRAMTQAEGHRPGE